MKKCNKCKVEKPLSEFNKNKTRKDGLGTNCKECAKEESKKYYNLNPDTHKKNVRKRTVDTVSKIRIFIDSLKQKGCCNCPENDESCLDFHHLNPDTKEASISTLVSWASSLKRIQAELDKCIILCANCHRKLHAGKIDLGVKLLK